MSDEGMDEPVIISIDWWASGGSWWSDTMHWIGYRGVCPMTIHNDDEDVEGIRWNREDW